MMNRLIVLSIVLPGALMAQPFSESMADCASIHQNAAQWVENDENAARLMQVANQWAAAAVAQSAAEGRPLSDDAIWARIDSKTAEWEKKGSTFFLTEEFRDWTDYCRAFARDRGIETGI